MWIRAYGRSMAPLFSSGAELLAERCAARSLCLGDVAVLAAPEGHLVAHVVCGVAPLRTSTYLGSLDRSSLRAIGKVVAVRRFGLAVATPRLLALAGHRLLSRASVRRSLSVGWHGVLSVTSPVRRRLFGRAAVRSLAPGEEPQAARLAAGVLGGAVLASLERATAVQQVFIALIGTRWLGVAWRSEGSELIAVEPWAQAVGVEAALRQALP